MLPHGCALGEHSSGGIWKVRASSFKCYVDDPHTMYSSGNIDVWNWVNYFESHCKTPYHRCFPCESVVIFIYVFTFINHLAHIHSDIK